MRPEVLAGIERELRQQAESEGIAHFVVGVAVFRGGKLLVVRRVEGSHQGMWELPGGVEPGESFADCVARELFEETALRVVRITDVLGGFDYATRTKSRVRKYSFVVEAEGGEIRLDPAEHDRFQWIDSDTVDNLPMADDMRAAVFALVTTHPSR
ncbi:NUDIX hydrolase [Nocardia seriolae]|uniref:8-oxo-dGTP diphosphatase n=1 Tax=Nocardia seriolae TaxID=37332 RepID=A0A0B8N6U9_9NOCA|nr:NUDIX domain-containing protein [Nocardia seriolae]APA94682.1 8-oxo-dGTP diphosphatase [Nocardia seriolae]MTJ67002.1 NUDIX domain-containing protein [Nocardia seriolae]MTJ70049.1 NUDIX domain-containing protein [Nocardia seriolae]MTJ84981.1 NUDIX domain-containing protein [Nocardia seriolae]MTK28977.1 NUDIX domain-containing protein [Nocardia seriolae]